MYRWNPARCRTALPWGVTAVLVVAAVFGARPAAAQAFGQWSWNAAVGYSQQQLTNEIVGGKSVDYNESELDFRLGLKGFILHPYIAPFRIGFRGSLAEYETSLATNSDRYSVFGAVDLFPFGRYRGNLHFHLGRSVYERLLEDAGNRELVFVGGVAENRDEFGGALRVRGGALQGLDLSFRYSEIDFAGPEQQRYGSQTNALGWSRQKGKFDQRYTLTRNARKVAGRYEVDDLLANAFGSIRINDDWTWRFTGHANDNTFTAGEVDLNTQTYTLRNTVLRTSRPDRSLQINQQSSVRNVETSTATSHRISVRQAMTFANGLNLTPIVTVSAQAIEKSSVDAAQAGVSTSWSRSLGKVRLLLAGSVAFGQAVNQNPVEEVHQDFVATNVGLGLSGGSTKTVATSLDLRYFQNDLETQRTLVDLPGDLSGDLLLIGVTDRTEGDLRLQRAVRGVEFYLRERWTHETNKPDILTSQTEIERLSHILTARSRHLSVSIQAWENRVRLEDGERLDEYVMFSAAWEPLRTLSVTGSYQVGERRSLLVAAANVDTYTVSAALNFAGFLIQGSIYETHEKQNGFERNYAGVNWSVTRGLSGWLPIVTAPQRRGVIR